MPVFVFNVQFPRRIYITPVFRDSSLLYEILLDLREHRYINHDSDTILNESMHQKERIYDYIDDLSIEIFFEYFNLRRIRITPDICFRRFSPYGLKDISSPIELDLSDKYDRYTFLSVITNTKFWRDKFPHNKFANNLQVSEKRYSACSDSMCLSCSAMMFNPYVAAFIEEYQYVDLDINRTATLYCYADFHSNFIKEIKYNIHPSNLYCEIVSDYAAIKDLEIFEGVSVEYALSIYCILCEKLCLSPIDYYSSRKLGFTNFSFSEGITPILAFGLDGESKEANETLDIFHKYELNISNFFNRDYVDIRDCYLHFVNPNDSKAFQFSFQEPYEGFVNVKLFKEVPVKSALMYNPIPLPYLYNKLSRL